MAKTTYKPGFSVPDHKREIEKFRAVNLRASKSRIDNELNHEVIWFKARIARLLENLMDEDAHILGLHGGLDN